MGSNRILIIEDDVDVLYVLKEVLAAQGHSVLGIAHPREVLTLDPSFDPDLIFVDLMLPEENGTHVAEFLREHGYLHAPIVAMSADRLALLFASRSGLFQDTLVKPFDLDTVSELVRVHAGTYVAYAVGI